MVRLVILQAENREKSPGIWRETCVAGGSGHEIERGIVYLANQEGFRSILSVLNKLTNIQQNGTKSVLR